MSVSEVKRYLDQWGRGKDVLEPDDSCATVELAAQTLGVIPARIAKTIAFAKTPALKGPASASSEQAAENFGCVLIVAAGDSKIDNAKFKSYFGFKARMLPPAETLAITGHAVGGVCPFAVNPEQVDVYLDVSLQRFATVFPACGSPNSLIELTPAELFLYSRSKEWLDVCKGWQENS